MTRLIRIALLVFCCCQLAWSAESSDDKSSSRWRGLETGAELNLEIQSVDGQDAPDEIQRDTTRVELELKLEASQRLSTLTELRAELLLASRRYSDSAVDSEDDDLSWKLERFFINHFNNDKSVRLRLGRQTLDDSMGWFIDEELDGLRITRDWNNVRADVSFTREDWVKAGSDEREEKTDNVLVVLSVEGTRKTRWTPYVLHRSASAFDGSDASETSWFGVQGLVDINERFGYWFNGALRDGSQDDDDGARELGGHAVDAGASWTFDRPYKPTVTLGYARASGDADSEDNDEDEFRQSGLHNNEFRLNGGNRFRYLGEVLDPELTNIEVLTVGLGARPSKRWTVDIAWHRYTQVELEDRIRGTDIEYEPSGQNDAIGDSLDLVVSVEPRKNLTIQALAGLFSPGKAFDDETRDAWLGRVELEYEF